MLVDLKWDLKHAAGRVRLEAIQSLDATNGHLVITWNRSLLDPTGMTGGEFAKPRTEAYRIAPGIYASFMLEHHISNFTEWEPRFNQEFGIFRAYWSELSAPLTSESRREEIRLEIRQALQRDNRSSYGLADDLRQVYDYGRRYVRSQHPYVLEIKPFQNDGVRGSGFRWHKQGPYIGRRDQRTFGEHFGDTPEITEVLGFSFVRLNKKSEESSCTS